MDACCKKIKEDFNKHPESIGETYLEHMWCCFKTSGMLTSISLVLLIHGVFPFLFTETGSSLIKDLHDTMQKRLDCDIKESGDTHTG
tara:strand:+ start:657 stop:917 length:261 start_codon:yes stop_codon:yes gene_type:complete